MQVFVAITTYAGHHDNYTAPSMINVGLLQPLEGPLGFERTGSAASMAVRDAQSRGYLNQTDVRYNSIRGCICLVMFSLTRQMFNSTVKIYILDDTITPH